ncbi:Bud site selection protein, Revert to axial protein 1, partial [Actinomortierella wolfii]
PAPRSMSLELIKPHWTVAKRFLDMSHEERQEYGEQTGLRWEDVKDVMLERAKLEEAQLDQELLRQEREGSSAETQDQQMASLDVQQSLQVQPHLRDMTNIDGKLGAKHSLEPILLSDASLGYQPRQSPSTPVSQDNLPVQDESSQQRQRKKVQTPIAGPSSAPAPSLAPRPNSTFRRQSSTGNGVSDGASAGASDTPRRGNAKGLSGMAVTREEVLRSAERIYLKYLTPQAEKHIYIPPSIRQRIAALMDGYLMNTHHQQQAYSEQRTTDADIASNGGNRNEDVASKDEARSTLTPSPASVERKEFSKSRSGVNWDSNHEKQGSYPGAAESTRARSFHSGPAAKGGMRASSTSQSIGRPNSPKGSFALPQPDQDLGLVFAEAREFVFTTMERYYFPRFLRARVYGNMVHLQRIFRLFLGLFFLFLGFTTVLCLIFLNAQPRSKRAWALIPMFTGVMLCTTFQFNLCPILAALNLSENKLMNFAKNKEPYIIRLHRLRALKVVAVAILYTTCLGIIFGFVPGYRL